MSKVGPYIMADTLGQGTFGKVKLARHKDTNIEYAIKILDKKDIKENELTINVRREIAVMKALNHQNIVNLREVLSSKSKLYIVMDLVRGGELFDMIEKKGELDEATARKYFQQLVDGIEYCHNRGVFHRDLKPENLLLDENGILKITDFGVSSVKKREGDMLFTACGTPYYCAPEILSNAPEGYNGAKVDCWSCGVICYLLLVGELPFHHEEMNVLYEIIQQCRVRYPASLSPGAKDLLSKILVRDPNVRYTLEDVKRHPWFLQDYEGGAAAGSGANMLQNSPSDPTRRLPPNVQRMAHTGSDHSRSREDVGAMRYSNEHFSSTVSSHASDASLPHSGSYGQGGGGGALAAGGVHGSPLPLRNNSYGDPHRRSAQNGFGLGPEQRSQESDEMLSTGSASHGGENHLLSNGYAPQSSPALAALNAPAPPPPPPPPMVFLAPKYEGKEMLEFVRDVLPGKPAKKLEDIVAKLSEIDIDCVEDVQAVAESSRTPDKFREWLQQQSSLPVVTSMRIAKAFFPTQN